MLRSRICRGHNRRFRFKIFGGQGFRRRKTFNSYYGCAGNNFFTKPYKKFNWLKIILFLAFFIVIKVGVFDSITVYASTESESEKSIYEAIEKVLATLDLTAFEKTFSDLELFNGQTLFYKITQIIKGNANSTFSEFLDNLKNAFKSEIFAFLPSISSILVIILFLAIIDALKPEGNTNKSLNSVCTFIGNLIIIGIVASVFLTMYTQSVKTVSTLTREIEVVFPLILTLMTASGGTASVSVFKPSVAILCNGISLLFDKVLLPIIILIFAFNAINSFSNTIKTDKMNDFLKSSFKWIIGITGVFFCFFVSAQGISASVYDSVSIKALKYAVGNSIPLINNLLASGFDVIVASCVLVKNALGTLTLIAIIYAVAIPILKLVIFSLFLRFFAGISQSIANDSTIKFLSGAADCVSYLATTVSVVAMVYMITLLIVMCSLGVSF